MKKIYMVAITLVVVAILGVLSYQYIFSESSKIIGHWNDDLTSESYYFYDNGLFVNDTYSSGSWSFQNGYLYFNNQVPYYRYAFQESHNEKYLFLYSTYDNSVIILNYIGEAGPI